MTFAVDDTNYLTLKMLEEEEAGSPEKGAGVRSWFAWRIG